LGDQTWALAKDDHALVKCELAGATSSKAPTEAG